MDPLAAHLSALGHRVICPDTIGRGLSQWSSQPEKDYCLESYARIAASLGHLDPRAILARGYSIVTDESGNILSDSRALEPNDRITVSFNAGRAEAMITSVRH